MGAPGTRRMFRSGTYAVPIADQGVHTDPGGSANHLAPIYFRQGAQTLPTGTRGTAQGSVGSSSESGCSFCDWFTGHIALIALGILVLILLFLAMGKK